FFLRSQPVEERDRPLWSSRRPRCLCSQLLLLLFASGGSESRQLRWLPGSAQQSRPHPIRLDLHDRTLPFRWDLKPGAVGEEVRETPFLGSRERVEGVWLCSQMQSQNN